MPQSAGKPRAPAAVTVTVLSNGLRVASQDAGGAVSSVALHLKAGSRYDELPGTAAVLGAMAFKASTRRSAAKTRRDIEGIGATVDARVSRETIVYSGAWKRGALHGRCSSCGLPLAAPVAQPENAPTLLYPHPTPPGEVLRDGASELAEVMAESLTSPAFLSWEVSAASGDLSEALACPEPSAALLVDLHAAAYGASSPLGRAVGGTAEGLEALDAASLRGALGARLTAANAVFSGVNLPHDELVDLAEAAFGVLPSGTGGSAGAGGAAPSLEGGALATRSDSGRVLVGVGLAGAAAGVSARAAAAGGILQVLLNGSGARGRGRLSALPGGLSACAFSYSYADAGLMGLTGVAPAGGEGALLAAMVAALKDAAGGKPITTAELAAAKANYALSLLAAAERRASARDELAQGLLLGGAPAGGALVAKLAAVSAVTAEDVAGVLRAALAAPPSLAAIGGPLANLPRYDRFAAMLK